MGPGVIPGLGLSGGSRGGAAGRVQGWGCGVGPGVGLQGGSWGGAAGRVLGWGCREDVAQ